MRWAVGFFVVLLSEVLLVAPVLACTCAAPATTEKALHLSSVIFWGKVIEIYRPFLDRIGITSSHTYRVRFVIINSWKGIDSVEYVVTTRLSDEACGYAFKQGKEYLVYVVKDGREIETGICTGTKDIARAKSEMKELNVLLNSPSSHMK